MHVFDIVTAAINKNGKTVMQALVQACEAIVFPEYARLRKPALYRVLREDPAKFIQEIAHQIFQRSDRITILNLLTSDPDMGISAVDAEAIAKMADKDLTLHILRRNGNIDITEEVFMEFVRTYDRQILEHLLLRIRGMRITNAILDAAITNDWRRDEILEFLLANWSLDDTMDSAYTVCI